MFIFSLLSALLPKRAPIVAPGTRVNQIRSNGYVYHCDGVVVADTSEGVLVDWARGGSSTVPRGELAFIA